jgi:hypothetical protein
VRSTVLDNILSVITSNYRHIHIWFYVYKDHIILFSWVWPDLIKTAMASSSCYSWGTLGGQKSRRRIMVILICIYVSYIRLWLITRCNSVRKLFWGRNCVSSNRSLSEKVVAGQPVHVEHLENLGPRLWSLFLAILTIFWRIWQIFRRIWQIFGEFDKFSANLTNFRRFWQIFGDFEVYLAILNFLAILKFYGRFWQIFSEKIKFNLKNNVLINVRIFWVKNANFCRQTVRAKIFLQS